ncbi:MAG: hypothetical protein WKG00_27660 [Polyangiaceae bacterium]
MPNPRRNLEAQQRAAARRQREDDAPRLHDKVPGLESLKLEVDEVRGAEAVAGATHIRRVVVEHAPALFVIPCSDRECKEGGHDVSEPILESLGAQKTSFDGRHACAGQVPTGPCGLTMRYRASATYR